MGSARMAWNPKPVLRPWNCIRTAIPSSTTTTLSPVHRNTATTVFVPAASDLSSHSAFQSSSHTLSHSVIIIYAPHAKPNSRSAPTNFVQSIRCGAVVLLSERIFSIQMFLRSPHEKDYNVPWINQFLKSRDINVS